MWYDVFSLFYDRALEDLYLPFRQAAVDALRLKPGDTVLDIPCGTGQGLDFLSSAVGHHGKVVGVDVSPGMLRKARKRVIKKELSNVTLMQSSVDALDHTVFEQETGVTDFDGVICSLGLTAFPSWQDSFHILFNLVQPGGRLVIFDVHAAVPTRESKTVELVARADLSNRVWELLESEASDYERVILDADAGKFGGELYIASGQKGAL